LKDSTPKFVEKSNYVPGIRRGLQGNTKQFPMPSTTTLRRTYQRSVFAVPSSTVIVFKPYQKSNVAGWDMDTDVLAETSQSDSDTYYEFCNNCRSVPY
jgi:hypothetical protein